MSFSIYLSTEERGESGMIRAESTLYMFVYFLLPHDLLSSLPLQVV